MSKLFVDEPGLNNNFYYMASTIEKNVMAAVRVAYVGRLLGSATALKVYAFAISVVGVAAFVSVPHVAANFMAVANGGFGAVTVFLLAAVTQTKVMVQAALLVGMFALASLGLEAVRSVRFHGPVHARA